MFARLLPKSAPFFELLLRESVLLKEAAKCLEESFKHPAIMEEHYKAVAVLEAEADTVYSRVTRELSRTFITPIDREDILRINQAQEDCIDFIQRLTTRMHIFDFPLIRFPALKLVETMRSMLEITHLMLEGLTEKRDVHKTRAFRSLSEDCEMLHSVGLAELYDSAEFQAESTLDVIKWVQAYARLESAKEEVVKLFEVLEEAVLKHV